MNRISKLLSIVILFSIVLATENNEEAVVEKTTFADDNNTEHISNNVEIAPVDIEKMKKVRQAKAEIEKMNAIRFLQKHKNPVPVADANMKAFVDRKQAEERIIKNKRNGFLKRFTESIRKKFPTMRLRSADGKRAIKFPTNTQTN